MTCDRTAQVHAFHDGQLGPAARESFEAHLADCAACAQLLGEVRAVSRLIASTSLPEVPGDTSITRYYAAWDASRQRGLLRISSWLTAAAAAVLVGSLVLLQPADTQPGPTGPTAVAVADAGAWEPVALMPPPERRGERPDAFIELAQWMAEDLSDGQFQNR